MTVDENIQLGVDLAKAFAVFGVIVFGAGCCAGYTLRVWRERRAKSLKQRSWLAEQKRLHEERVRVVTGEDIETLLTFHNPADHA